MSLGTGRVDVAPDGPDPRWPSAPRWQGARSLRRAALLCLLLPALALLTGRADLVVLAAPLVVGTVLAMARTARAVPLPGAAGCRVRAPAQSGQGEEVELALELWLPLAAEAGVVRVPEGDRLPFGVEAVVGAGAGGQPRRIGQRVLLPLWGRVVLARPDVRAIGPDALVVAEPAVGRQHTVAVLPAPERPAPAPLRPRTAGVVGAHRTRRPGEGTDLLDVREFRPGDRVRRIDWRVSARRGSLHVRRTAADVDADVVLLLDTRLDVGPEVAGWARPPGPGGLGTSELGSSLDLTVRTALTLARTFLDQGDRVALVDLSRPRLSVPPRTGRRQLRRLRRQLVEVGVHAAARRLLLRPGVVPPGAVAVLVSPLLDPPVTDLAAQLRRRGAQVIAVDVLPSRLDRRMDTEREAVAVRLVMAERAHRLEGLRALGVCVVDGSAGVVARVLRDQARRRRQVGR